MKQAIFVFSVIIFLISCSPSEADVQTIAAQTEEARPCSEKSIEYLETVELLLDKWDDTDELAGSTSRIALSGPVATLQELKQEAISLNPPKCAQSVSNIMSNYMDSTIDGYLAFMSEEPDDVVQMMFFLEELLRIDLETSIDALRDDTPESTILVHYIITGSLDRYDIKFRNSDGQTAEADSVLVPWSTSLSIGRGGLVTLQTAAASGRTITANCAIIAGGQIVDIQSDSGFQVGVQCSGNAE